MGTSKLTGVPAGMRTVYLMAALDVDSPAATRSTAGAISRSGRRSFHSSTPLAPSDTAASSSASGAIHGERKTGGFGNLRPGRRAGQGRETARKIRLPHGMREAGWSHRMAELVSSHLARSIVGSAK